MYSQATKFKLLPVEAYIIYLLVYTCRISRFYCNIYIYS